MENSIMWVQRISVRSHDGIVPLHLFLPATGDAYLLIGVYIKVALTTLKKSGV